MRVNRLAGLTILLVGLVFLAGRQATAREADIQELTAPDVKKMLANGQTTLINVLSGIEYDVQHIPGSINIPIVFMHSSNELPTDKKAPLVFHCLSDR